MAKKKKRNNKQNNLKRSNSTSHIKQDEILEINKEIQKEENTVASHEKTNKSTDKTNEVINNANEATSSENITGDNANESKEKSTTNVETIEDENIKKFQDEEIEEELCEPISTTENKIKEETQNPGEKVENNLSTNKNSTDKVSLKNKIIITGIVSALTASTTTAIICKNYYYKKYNTETQEMMPYEESSLSLLGEKLKEKNLLEINPVYTIDPQYDYRFDNIKDYILDSCVLTSSSNEKLQEIYIIKTNDTEIVKRELETCKASLEASKNDSNRNAIDKSVVEIKGNYVYLIASENTRKIERYILKHLK